jgi:hypothetical protein
VAVHVEPEPSVWVYVGPEEGREPAAVIGADQVVELRNLKNGLEQQGVDMHQRRLEQVQGEHGDFSVLAVGAGRYRRIAPMFFSLGSSRKPSSSVNANPTTDVMWTSQGLRFASRTVLFTCTSACGGVRIKGAPSAASWGFFVSLKKLSSVVTKTSPS